MAARLRDTAAAWLRWAADRVSTAADRLTPAVEVVEERTVPGAPEHWLRRVRDHAPQLLRPAGQPAKVLAFAAAASVRPAPAPATTEPTPAVPWTPMAVAVSAAAAPPAPRVSTEDSTPPQPNRHMSTQDSTPPRPVRHMSTEDGERPAAVRLRPAAPQPAHSPAPQPSPATAAVPRPASAPGAESAPRVELAPRVVEDPQPVRPAMPAVGEELRRAAAPTRVDAPEPLRPRRASADRPERARRPVVHFPDLEAPGQDAVVLRWPDLPDSARAAWGDEPGQHPTPPHPGPRAVVRPEHAVPKPPPMPEVTAHTAMEHVVRSGPWPRLGDETTSRWPELPADTAQWEVTPRRGDDRIRRLDEEQRGLPWNA